ncbi:MAG: UDP-N-acetylmuramyl-tripeptide synthetase, partial [Clostridia bacterium]|nr:UDP-N-acetylmuramyl-tripeptide synthetase [Clostridia bacterium]
VGLSNITKDHLDFFVTMENYQKAKASLFTCKHAKCGVVNADCKENRDAIKNSDLTNMFVGKDCELKIVEIKEGLQATNVEIMWQGKTYKFSTNLIGRYNIDNLMLAIGTLLKLDFNLKDILNVIKTTTFVIPGRFNVLNVNANYAVVVDYAHTPDGIKNILSTLRNLPVNKIITVFGCGGNRDKTKRPEMGKMAVTYSDKVILTTDNPRDETPDLIIDDIVEGNDASKFVRITERKSAIEYALSIAKENDVVAILGKGAETYQEICGVKVPFSDYEVVDNYFKFYDAGEISI